MRKRCAFLTMDDLGGLVADADLSIQPMSELGWDVDMVSWRDTNVQWDLYDAVYICTPWDYTQDADAFVGVLETIANSSAKLVNDLSLVRWTLAKTYLRDLEAHGVAIVPSLWFDDFNTEQSHSYFEALATDTVVIKPAIGASAVDTFVLTKPVSGEMNTHLLDTFSDRSFLVQPYMQNISSEGEYSLIFLNGEYSHAVLKTPLQGDFRSQEEYGAEIKGIEASVTLIRAAQLVLSFVDPQPVYVRADFVRGNDDEFLLMELEMIEPSLYFRANEESAARFAAAFDEHIRTQS